MDGVVVYRDLDARSHKDEAFEKFRLAVCMPSETTVDGTPYFSCQVYYGPIDDPIVHSVYGEDRMAALENGLAFLTFFAASLDNTHEVRATESGRPYAELLLPISKKLREDLARKLTE